MDNLTVSDYRKLHIKRQINLDKLSEHTHTLELWKMPKPLLYPQEENTFISITEKNNVFIY